MKVRGPDNRKTDRFQRYQPPRKSPLPLVKLLTTAIAGGTVIVTLIAGLAFWRFGNRVTEGIQLMLTPQPPEESVDIRTVVVQQVRGASELTTAVFSMEAVVPATSDRTFGRYTVGKTNLLYIAYGEVRAGVDLQELKAADVQPLEPKTETAAGEESALAAAVEPAELERSVRIVLPPPQILDTKIDVERSSVYDYSRGFLNLGPDRAPQLQEMAQREALDKIEQAACDQGILTQANERAELVVSQLLSSAGFDNIIVETQPVTADTCIAGRPKAD
ncbi:DUF4230 domain-containing protein [Romeria aff. gracilis LEGE 07310]|uniref:DUF4230 domain-containing protein n=1 Tax=Vasconcelosia minhoensis LEGE 07310 TaxID=915328 RepID=A0A8J7AY07_9CYAN|nr:DUF4230 domain-containing protein [Romeria gracilis]MBE9079698.1 DUF4230 domain-containing protein [Romeria aff. gracilis LEGE 07310]